MASWWLLPALSGWWEGWLSGCPWEVRRARSSPSEQRGALSGQRQTRGVKVGVTAALASGHFPRGCASLRERMRVSGGRPWVVLGLTTLLFGRRVWSRLLIFCEAKCPGQCREDGDGTRGRWVGQAPGSSRGDGRLSGARPAAGLAASWVWESLLPPPCPHLLPTRAPAGRRSFKEKVSVT